MRIAVLTEHFPSPTETFIAREADGLRALGHEVAVGALTRPAREWAVGDEAPPPLRPAPPSLPARLRALAALARLGPHGLRRTGWVWSALAGLPAPDVVLAQFASVPAVAGPGLAAGWKAGFVVSAHARDLFVPWAPGIRAARRAARVLICSDAGRAAAAAAGLSYEHLRLVHHGIPGDFFGIERTPAAPPLLLSVGRLVPKKGYPVLLEAFAALHRDRPDLRLRILGDGPDADALRDRASALGVQTSVTWAGRATPGAVRASLAEAAVYVQPSTVAPDGDRDGIPNALLEAMAAGVPVVGTEVGGLPEAIRHRETGLLAPPDHPAHLADALRETLDHPADAEARAQTARTFVQEAFNPRRNAQRLGEVLREAAHGNTGGRR